MKKINQSIVLLLIIVGILLSTVKSFAQTSTTQYITIEKNIAQIDNLSIIDSTGANGKILRNASFEITVTNAEPTVAIITALQAALIDNKQASLVFSKVQFAANTGEGQLKEERKYTNYIVKSMLLPALNATEKTAIKLQVKIQAETVAINYMNTPFTIKQFKKGTPALTASYKLTIEGLPTNRVSKISALQISKNNAAQNISIELMAVDERLWNETYSAGKILEKGVIELLAPNFRDVILTINIGQMRINSYSSTSTGNTIAKSVYGLSAGTVSIQ
jgi:hypothetical protein